MLDSLKISIKTLLNVSILMGVCIYIGAIIGMWLFSGKLPGVRYNFDDI